MSVGEREAERGTNIFMKDGTQPQGTHYCKYHRIIVSEKISVLILTVMHDEHENYFFVSVGRGPRSGECFSNRIIIQPWLSVVYEQDCTGKRGMWHRTERNMISGETM